MIELEKIKKITGENFHMQASLNMSEKMLDYDVLNENELTYSDYSNMTVAVNVMSEFYDVYATVIVQNSAPCAVALGKDLYESYEKAFDCDPISAFTSVIGFTKEVDEKVAEHVKQIGVETLLAPSYSEKAIEILRDCKFIKLVKINTPLLEVKGYLQEEVKVTPFGILKEEANLKELDKDTFKVVTKAKPTEEQIEDAIFAWKVAKYAKSDAIVVAKNFKTLSIAQGFASRVQAVEWAMDYACDGTKDAVMASDGFIPAIDSIQAAVQGRIGLIIQPAGSQRDNEVVQISDKYGISMIITGFSNLKI